MNIAITLDIINERLACEGNVMEEESSIKRVGEKLLTNVELLEREIKEIQFHASRFASEGATLRQINQYKSLMDYLTLLYQKQEYDKCEKVATVIKLFFKLDINFLHILPQLKWEIEERGPIYFETLVNSARRYIGKNSNKR